MQPYFFPYIGYFQLIASVDLFIVYDNIKYTKKGWINRNRMLQNGKTIIFSIPLKNDSDYLRICERRLSENFDRDKLLNKFNSAYRLAPFFARTFGLIEQIVRHEDTNLFGFLHHSIVRICEHLNIKTEIRISSSYPINHNLKKQEKVFALCSEVGAGIYVNPIGGKELYSKESFRENGFELKFIQSVPFEYSHFGDTFVPWLSIIDVMMFNRLDTIESYISANYKLL
ncbi:WbqC family protein [Pseudomonadota bacterium]